MGLVSFPRWACTSSLQGTNKRILSLLNFLQTFKNGLEKQNKGMFITLVSKHSSTNQKPTKKQFLFVWQPRYFHHGCFQTKSMNRWAVILESRISALIYHCYTGNNHCRSSNTGNKDPLSFYLVGEGKMSLATQQISKQVLDAHCLLPQKNDFLRNCRWC